MNTLERNADKLVRDIKRVVRDSEDFLRSTAEAAGDKAHEARERLNDAVATARRTCCDLQDKTVESAKATDRIVRSHPYESIGVAFGLGLLIGLFMIRK